MVHLCSRSNSSIRNWDKTQLINIGVATNVLVSHFCLLHISITKETTWSILNLKRKIVRNLHNEYKWEYTDRTKLRTHAAQKKKRKKKDVPANNLSRQFSFFGSYYFSCCRKLLLISEPVLSSEILKFLIDFVLNTLKSLCIKYEISEESRSQVRMPSFLLSRISRKGLLYYSLNITLFVFLLIFLIAFLVVFLFSMFLPYYFPFLLSLLWKNSTIKSKIGASVTFLNRSCRNNRIRKGKKKTKPNKWKPEEILPILNTTKRDISWLRINSVRFFLKPDV